VVIGYVMFFLAGLGFGYAAPGKAKLIPLLFPLLLALGAILRDGLSGAVVLRLVIAIILTVVGIVLGNVIESRDTGEAAGARS
jgi:hypothetical protein